MDRDTILLWIFILLFLLALLFHTGREKSLGTNAKAIAKDALFLTLIVLMGFVPQLGYITLFPGLSLTLIHLPVILGSALYGPKKGLLYGFFFGVTSCLVAIQNPVGFNAFFVYPWVSVLPRMLFGFLCGFFFQLVGKNPKIGRSAWMIGLLSFLSSVLHTLLVFGCLFLFFGKEILPFFQSQEAVTSVLSLTFLGVILLGALGEATLSLILIPPLYKVALRTTNRKAY